MTTTERKLMLDRIFNPRGVAFFGGVSKPGSFGNLVMLAQIRYGYGGKLYPVSPKGGEVTGIKVCKSLAEADGPVDLAMISVPAPAVPSVVKDCLEHGVTGAQIHSSGFAELGTEEGRKLQDELKSLADQGICLIGPNCFGLHCPAGGITVLPGADFSKIPGPLALISQSGGVATDFGHEARRAGLGISKIASFGNGCDVHASELLEYFSADPETDLIGAYIEGVPDARRFMGLLKKTTPDKHVVLWKAGLTPLGGRAAQSHTGSMAGESGLWRGALRQAGALQVESLDEMFDSLTALYYLKNRGKRVAIVGGGGAIGVFLSDLAHRYGLDVPLFGRDTRDALRKYFPTPGNSMANPLDTGTPVLEMDAMKAICGIVLEREPIDVLLVILLLRPIELETNRFFTLLGIDPPEPGSYVEELLEALTDLKASTGKDVAVVLDNRAHNPEDIEVEIVRRRLASMYQEKGIPVFYSPERAIRGIALASK